MKLYPSKKQWQYWTLPSKAGFISLVIAIIGIPLWIISYTTSATKENQEKIIQGQNRIYEEVLELKNATIHGDKQLVEQISNQIDNKRKWDFKTGSMLFWVYKKNFFNGKSLNLFSIKSKENSASIRLNKTSTDYIQIIYSYPTIGDIVRETQVTPDNFEDFRVDPKKIREILGNSIYVRELNTVDCPQCVLLGFSWNLKEARTTLYINGKERPKE